MADPTITLTDPELPAPLEVDLTEAPKEEEKPLKPEEKAAAAAEKPKAAPPPAPDPMLEKLKRQLAEEKAARESAQREADTARQSEIKAKTETQATNIDLIVSAIGALKSANEGLKARYREARAANDTDAEFDVQQAISENAAKLVQLEAGKVALERAPKPQMERSTDPVDMLAAQLSPRSAQWVRAHPAYARSKPMYDQMVGADSLARGRGFEADTDGYFAEVEKILGLEPARANGEDNQEESFSEAAKPKASARQAPPAAAPVSRGSEATGGSGRRTMSLTAEEVQMAKDTGQTPEEYARHKDALIKEGKIGRVN